MHSAPVVNNVRCYSNSDRFLRRSEMARCVQARASCLDHFDNAAQMPIGALEPLDDLRMGLVEVATLVYL
jgi:hypothetical protein